MANGIKTPVKASKAGGAEILKGTKQKAKILRLALSEGDDNNPFQKLGIMPDALFQNEGPTAAADLRLEVERILKKFSDSIGIDPNFPVTIFKSETGELGVTFKWVDLETNDTTDFSEFLQIPGGVS